MHENLDEFPRELYLVKKQSPKITNVMTLLYSIIEMTKLQQWGKKISVCLPVVKDGVGWGIGKVGGMLMWLNKERTFC